MEFGLKKLRKLTGITYVGINMPTQACGRQSKFYFALTGLEEVGG